MAERFDRDFHGTVWILRRFFELGLASATATRSHFAVLSQRGIRLPWKMVDEFLTEIGERPLDDV